jgi:hypothetical protein
LASKNPRSTLFVRSKPLRKRILNHGQSRKPFSEESAKNDDFSGPSTLPLARVAGHIPSSGAPV